MDAGRERSQRGKKTIPVDKHLAVVGDDCGGLLGYVVRAVSRSAAKRRGRRTSGQMDFSPGHRLS